MAPGTMVNFRRIRANDENITELELNIGPFISHQKKRCGWMGRAIGMNTHMKKLTLTFPPDETVERLRALWRGLIYNKSIEEIKFGTFPVIPEKDFGLFMQLFQNNHNLKTLIFDDKCFLYRNFDFICSTLGRCESLKYVTINSYFLPMDRFLELSTLLAGLPWLERISLCKQDRFVEFPSLSNALKGFLQMDQSAIRELQFVVGRGIKMNNDLLVCLANSLKSNTHLEKLELTESQWLDEGGDSLEDGWNAMEESLCLDNDTFHKFSFAGHRMPQKIQELLSLNKDEDKKFVRFRKGLDYGFLFPGRDFKAEPFGEDFDIRLLPHVLSSIGSPRNDNDHRSQQYRQSALFYFVQSMPLFVVESGKNVAEADASSKRRKSSRIAAARKKKCLGK